MRGDGSQGGSRPQSGPGSQPGPGSPQGPGSGSPRIGVFGGTFDPVHIGHLVTALEVRHALDLDRVLLVVANVPWQKVAARTITAAEDRFTMVRAAVDGVEGLEASRLELDRGGDSYTADTLAELGELHPGSELFVVVGTDVAGMLGTWDRWQEVQTLATVVVVDRPGGTGTPLGSGWRSVQVAVPGLDVSSTDLRARVGDGRPLRFLVPDGALRLIHERGLYARSG